MDGAIYIVVGLGAAYVVWLIGVSWIHTFFAHKEEMLNKMIEKGE